MIGKCCDWNHSRRDAINTFIIPRLKMYLEWNEPAIAPFKELNRTLLESVHHLRKRPTCSTDRNINMINIMVDDDATVTGIWTRKKLIGYPLG
jgi:hypothetical protein